MGRALSNLWQMFEQVNREGQLLVAMAVEWVNNCPTLFSSASNGEDTESSPIVVDGPTNIKCSRRNDRICFYRYKE